MRTHFLPIGCSAPKVVKILLFKKHHFLDFVQLQIQIWWKTDKCRPHTPLAFKVHIFVCFQKIFGWRVEISAKIIRPLAKELNLALFFSQRL